MSPQRTKVIAGSLAALALGITSFTPAQSQAHATEFAMRPTKVEFNGKQLSTPSGFTYLKTTYLPLYYVQQLLKVLQIDNTWDGSTWNIKAPFTAQPLPQLNTKQGPMAIQVNGQTIVGNVLKVVAIDPASGQKTTFIPIWYIQQALRAIDLDSTWNGTVWNAQANYTAYTKTGTRLAQFDTLSEAQMALQDYPGGYLQDNAGATVFTEASFKNVDLGRAAPANVTASSINQYLTAHNFIMAGLDQVFMAAEQTYGVDANYLVSHAMEETGTGANVTNIATAKNNLYGYGAFDANAGVDAARFPSEGYAILFEAWEVRNNYLNLGASHYVTPTLNGMASNYASDPEWANKVNNLMDQFAIDLHDTVNSYPQYAQGTNPTPAPASSAAEPSYALSGAAGVVGTDSYYASSVPVYADAASGQNHMFARILQLNDQGSDVMILQQALNARTGASLDVDGVFGAQTQAALEQLQTASGLPATGTCDFNLWNNVLNLSHPLATVSPGQMVQVDAMMMGMAGGLATEWDHIPNVGWVNANDVSLTNVYKLNVSDWTTAAGVQVPVFDATGKQMATLHAGDYVVAGLSTVASGSTAIQFNDQTTGAAETGYIQAPVSLVQVNQ